MTVVDMTTADKIVYSQLVYESICAGGRETYSYTGKDLSVREYVENSDSLVPIGDSVTISSISRHTNLSRYQCSISMRKLRDSDFIVTTDLGDEQVKLIDGLTDRFFQLHPKKGLNCLNLIVYSYLANKTEKFGWVDKYHDAIAKELGLSNLVLANCLRNLVAKKLIEKKKRGRQVLLRAVI